MDSAGEADKIEMRIKFLCDHRCLLRDEHACFHENYIEIGKMLSSVIKEPEKFC